MAERLEIDQAELHLPRVVVGEYAAKRNKYGYKTIIEGRGETKLVDRAALQ
jgi:hypothetical protein